MSHPRPQSARGRAAARQAAKAAKLRDDRKAVELSRQARARSNGQRPRPST